MRLLLVQKEQHPAVHKSVQSYQIQIDVLQSLAKLGLLLNRTLELKR